MATDMPPKIIRDAYLELTPAQREAYDLAEKEGVVHLNELGDTITVQHVFELVMRLKQICNFDPRTGESAKLEQLLADMAGGRRRAAARRSSSRSGSSRWKCSPATLQPFGPLQYHGKIPHEGPPADPRPVQERPDQARHPDELRHRQRRAEPAIHQLRVPVRPLVEPGHRGPGHQPRPPARPESDGVRDALHQRRTPSKAASPKCWRRNGSCSTS